MFHNNNHMTDDNRHDNIIIKFIYMYESRLNKLDYLLFTLTDQCYCLFDLSIIGNDDDRASLSRVHRSDS